MDIGDPRIALTSHGGHHAAVADEYAIVSPALGGAAHEALEIINPGDFLGIR